MASPETSCVLCGGSFSGHSKCVEVLCTYAGKGCTGSRCHAECADEYADRWLREEIKGNKTQNSKRIDVFKKAITKYNTLRRLDLVNTCLVLGCPGRISQANFVPLVAHAAATPLASTTKTNAQRTKSKSTAQTKNSIHSTTTTNTNNTTYTEAPKAAGQHARGLPASATMSVAKAREFLGLKPKCDEVSDEDSDVGDHIPSSPSHIQKLMPARASSHPSSPTSDASQQTNNLDSDPPWPPDDFQHHRHSQQTHHHKRQSVPIDMPSPHSVWNDKNKTHGHDCVYAGPFGRETTEEASMPHFHQILRGHGGTTVADSKNRKNSDRKEHDECQKDDAVLVASSASTQSYASKASSFGASMTQEHKNVFDYTQYKRAAEAAKRSLAGSPQRTGHGNRKGKASSASFTVGTSRLSFAGGRRPNHLRLCRNIRDMGRCPVVNCEFVHSEEDLAAREIAWLEKERELERQRREASAEAFRREKEAEAEKAAIHAAYLEGFGIHNAAATVAADHAVRALNDPEMDRAMRCISQAAIGLMRNNKLQLCALQVMELGFEDEVAKAAAYLAGGNVEKAIAAALDGDPRERNLRGKAPDVDVMSELYSLLQIALEHGVDAHTVDIELNIAGGDWERAEKVLRAHCLAKGRHQEEWWLPADEDELLAVSLPADPFAVVAQTSVGGDRVQPSDTPGNETTATTTTATTTTTAKTGTRSNDVSNTTALNDPDPFSASTHPPALPVLPWQSEQPPAARTETHRAMDPGMMLHHAGFQHEHHLVPKTTNQKHHTHYASGRQEAGPNGMLAAYQRTKESLVALSTPLTGRISFSGVEFNEDAGQNKNHGEETDAMADVLALLGVGQ